jgi:type 1 glutamine amidotransferase
LSDALNAHLVVGGKYHDMDYARLELLKLLAEHEDVRTRVSEDYSPIDAIRSADFLVTYTCDVRPSDAEQQALADYVASGKRWLALHGTNSVMEFLESGLVSAPRTHGLLMETLGSRFLAHPPIEPYSVRNVAPEHPLVSGIANFEAEDELYLCEYHGEIEPLLETRYTGKALGFEEGEWPDDDARHVMYLHPVGEGAVLYLTLGHCRGHYDMKPVMDYYPRIERGAWNLPVFYELLRRALQWSAARLGDGLERTPQ